MSALAKLMDDTAADPLRHARQHAERGGRVIGLVGADVPAELVLAADALPVTLPALADGATEEADRYLEPSFTPWLRSITDQWLRGAFDFMEAVVFSRSDDSAQRCYYYLCELQRNGIARGPTPLVFDIAKIPRATSLAHTEAAAHNLAAALASRLERLPAAIAARNERRALFRRLDLQRQSPSAPAGPLCAELLRLGDAVPAERFDRDLAAWLDGGFAPHPGPRVLLAGSAPPDERLHAAVEHAGGRVVAEVGDHALDRLGPPIGSAPNPLHALARHYHVLDYGPRSFADRAAHLVRRVAESRADGVVVWLIEQDEATGWQLPAMAAALATAGVPLLSLTRRRWDAQDGALEELAAFTRGLGVHT